MVDKRKMDAFLQTQIVDDNDTPKHSTGINEDERPKLVKKESLKEFLVMESKEGDISLADMDLDDITDKDYADLSDEERMLLYGKGNSFKRLGNTNHALLCFLGCLKGLEPTSKSKFTMLPQCLTHISEIYANAGDYQKAVEFMQGTKLYYETAIIEAGIHVGQYKKQTGSEYSPLDLDPCLDEARRANEYERLSNSCLEQHKFQLALEYCGKAVKLRQKVYSDDHPITVKTLDLFTLIYAEMGKSQYSEAMTKYSNITSGNDEQKDKALNSGNHDNEPHAKTTSQTDDSVETQESQPAPEVEEKQHADPLNEEETLRDEKPHAQDPSSKKSKQVRFSSDTQSSTDRQITACHLLLFFFISAVIAVLLTIIWCRVTDSVSCPSQHYLYTQARYWYYFYFKSAGTNSSFY